jgi:signal transduction histidine kinase
VTVRSLLALAGSRSIDVEVEGEAVFGLGDRERLRQAMGNLIDNAIKYSPPSATVRVRTAATADEAIVSVHDDGPGVPAELRDRVFDRFYRVDSARAPATGGSGIGLSIARELARAHGGRVWLEAGSDGGSTFSLAIPGIAARDLLDDEEPSGQRGAGDGRDGADDAGDQQRLHDTPA